MNLKKRTFIFALEIFVLGLAVAGVVVAQSILFDKDIDLQGTKSILSASSIGIGTTTPAHNLDIVGAYYSRTVVKGTCTGTVNIDWNQGNTQHCILGSTPVTFTFSNGKSGGNYKLILKQDGVGSRTVTWPGTIRWGSGTAPYLTPTPLKTDYIGFFYNGADSAYDSVAFNANF